MNKKTDGPIYFLSGWAFHADIYKISALSDFGCTALPYHQCDDYSLDQLAPVLEKQMPSPGEVIAWSLGGLIAIKLAQLFPSKIKKIIFIASSPYLLGKGEWSGISANYYTSFVKTFTQDPQRCLDRFLSLMLYNSSKTNHTLLRSMRHYQCAPSNASIATQLSQFFKLDLREAYQNISVPMLHIISGNDQIVLQQGSPLLSLNKMTQVETVHEAGHAGFISLQQPYRNIIRRFIHE